jgi:hypothetical protein
MGREIYIPTNDRSDTGVLTPSQILSSIETVDGTGSGLDSDTIKGYVPIQQGGGASQLTTKLYIGADTATTLKVQINTTDIGHIVTEQTLQGKVSVSGSMYNPTATLTDGATVAWNLNTQQVAQVTLGGNRTLALPSNLSDGQYASLRVGRSGAYTLSFATGYKGVSTITQSSTSGYIDHFVFRCNGTQMELVSFAANVGA